jgi:hypothetical protein
MITAVTLALFFALLAVADLLPVPSDAPGLVAPLR